MQYSKDGKKFTLEMEKFDALRIAKSLGIIKGGWIYYRENEDAPVRKLQYGFRR